MNEVKVSIIIPTRNRASSLRRCLQSLLQQKYDEEIEIVVVDDSLTDECSKIVEELSHYSTSAQVYFRYLHIGGKGANACRNAGIKVAKGNILVFLDDDIIAPPHWLHTLINGLIKSDCEVVTGATRLPIHGTLIGKHRQEVRSLFGEILEPPRGLDGKIVPAAGNMAAFRHVFNKALFEETIRPPVEEVDWARRADVKVGFIPEAWLWHNKEPSEICLIKALQLAWQRGSEGGWWIRERARVSAKERWRLICCSLVTSGRALGHALIERCWGGVVIGLGELAKALALMGLINRGKRVAKSWR